MKTVFLKSEKISEIFSLVFPSDVPLAYSEERKSIEHPMNKGIWMKVNVNELIFQSEYHHA